MSAFFIAFWKGEERKIKSRENDMKIRRDFCIVFCICSRKECDNVQESDLQRASKILHTAFGSDWKQIVQTLGTRETRPDFFYGISRTGRRRQQSVERKLFPAGCSETHSVCKKMQAI